ncbi:MAG: hypothetical protein J5489_03250, partial [Lachnospiraceae bacterium]|nr:hypothetical protein [Lachnospiraceae bacterium]
MGVFDNFSKYRNSGRRRKPYREIVERRVIEPDYGPRSYDREPDYGPRSYEREPEYDHAQDYNYEPDRNYENERAEAATTIRELGRERTDLKAQVAELKQQVELLNSLMEVKENQVKELEKAMEN